jgi:hypothetical protein
MIVSLEKVKIDFFRVKCYTYDICHYILKGLCSNIPEAVFLARLGASSLPARNKLSMLFPYTSFPAGNELILKLTKNKASGFIIFGRKKFITL